MKIIIFFSLIFIASCKTPYALNKDSFKEGAVLDLLFTVNNNGDYSRYKMYVCSLVQVRKTVNNIEELHTVNITEKDKTPPFIPYTTNSFRLYFIHDTISNNAVFWSTKVNTDNFFIRVNDPIFGKFRHNRFTGNRKLVYDRKLNVFTHKPLKDIIYMDAPNETKGHINFEFVSYKTHKLSGNKPFIFEASDIYDSPFFFLFQQKKLI